MRDTDRGHHGQCLGYRAHPLQIQAAERRGTRLGRKPARQPADLPGTGRSRLSFHQHAERRFAHHLDHRVATQHLDAFAADLETLLPGAGVVEIGLRVAAVSAYIDPVPEAVGERPRDMTVRTCDHRRHTGQRYAVEFGRIAARGLQACAIPDGRHAQSEVHIARDQRGAALGVRAADHPSVAARLARRGRRRPACPLGTQIELLG